jgi:hypothetical protein
MTTIVVTKRADDYHACIEGQPSFWGCGKTPDAAVGSLVQSHPEQFSVKVQY